jgi:hypothetical protein
MLVLLMNPDEIRSLDDIEILHTHFLGKGYISTVKLAKHKLSGKLYAVKVVS